MGSTPNKTLPRHRQRIWLALRKIWHLFKSPLIPIHPQPLHQLRLQLQLLILRLVYGYMQPPLSRTSISALQLVILLVGPYCLYLLIWVNISTRNIHHLCQYLRYYQLQEFLRIPGLWLLFYPCLPLKLLRRKTLQLASNFAIVITITNVSSFSSRIPTSSILSSIHAPPAP